ncbi:MAG: M28 family peptidase [bacterium]
MKRMGLTSCVALLLASSISFGQSTSFIEPAFERCLLNELSGDLAYDAMRWLAHWHRETGSEDYHRAAVFVAEKAKEYGFEDVVIVRQKSDRPAYTAKTGELWVVEPEEIKLGSRAEYPLAVAMFSRTTHVKAELVDVGAGLADEDYKGKSVKDKIVLTSSQPGGVMTQAVWKRGALGIVSYYYHLVPRTSEMVERPDQVAWARIPFQSPDGKEEGTFAFMVSPRKGKMLQRLLEKEKVVVKVDIEAEITEPGWQEYVEGWIRGTKFNDQQIVLTAHLQEEKPSYNDNSSGCANLLDIGRTLIRLIGEGRINRPLRDLRFWWVTEISSEYQYLMEHPDERRKMLVNINQDMVGAKQSAGSRIQHITRTPHSIPSYLSDVVENITEYVILGNTHFLASEEMNRERPYSKPILSHLGTRERFGAMVVPYFNSTDHLVFNEGIIGVPGVTLTNMPDDFIHSTDDDAWQVDQTQLKRNAFIVTTSAWYLANAEENDVFVLGAEVYCNGLARINKDALKAREYFLKNKDNDPEDAYEAAYNLIEQAFTREVKALESVRVFAPQSSPTQGHIDALKTDMWSFRDRYLDDFDLFYKSVAGVSEVPPVSMTSRERKLDAKVPKNIADVAEYFRRRRKVRSIRGLHGEMAYEVYNFVDGKNSYFDIFKAVQAEAMSAGEFYYGVVRLEDVETLLDRAVQAKVLELK